VTLAWRAVTRSETIDLRTHTTPPFVSRICRRTGRMNLAAWPRLVTTRKHPSSSSATSTAPSPARRSCGGSWNDTIEHASSDPHAPETSIPTEELLAERQRLYDELGWIPTGSQLNEHSEHSRSMSQKQFGSWSAALNPAFDETAGAGAYVSNAAWLDELRHIAAEHGSPPMVPWTHAITVAIGNAPTQNSLGRRARRLQQPVLRHLIGRRFRPAISLRSSIDCVLS